jgi:hypothetical protein
MAEPQKKSIAETAKTFLVVHTPIFLLSYPCYSSGGPASPPLPFFFLYGPAWPDG